MGKRIPARDGDWFVQTPDQEWSKAIARMKAAVARRDKRLRAWEAKQPPGAVHSPGYWDRYRAEKCRIPIGYPMPHGHVMFGG